MIQETSIEAYKEIKDLGKKQRLVYNALELLGSATNKQIARYLNLPINSITPRIYELRQKKLVGVNKIDLDGKRKAIYWKCVK